MSNQNFNGDTSESRMETRFQTVAMVLIVGFLTWVGSGLVDVKVGLAQVLTEAISMKENMNRQGERLAVLESEVRDLRERLQDTVTRDEFRETMKQHSN
jgi:hypothetical protein